MLDKSPGLWYHTIRKRKEIHQMFTVEILYALSPADHYFFPTIERARKCAQLFAEDKNLPWPDGDKTCAILIKDKNNKIIERM